jgi:O-antigen/teichoic acid export membrane protein
LPNNEELRPGATVARGATYVFVQGFASAALGVVYYFFLAHLISQTEIGVFGVLTFAMGLIQTLGTLAFPSASIKYIAQFIAEGKRDQARAVVTRVLQVSMVIAVAASALVFALANSISSILSSEVSVSPAVIQILALVSGVLVLFYQSIAFLQGLQMLGKLAIVNLLFTCVQYGLAIFLVFLGYGLVGIMIGWLIALIAAVFLALSITTGSLGIFGKPYQMRPLLSFSAPLYVSNILSFVIQWIDQLFVLVVGYAAFGAYNIANRAAVVPGLISSALVAALFPKLSQLYAQEGKGGLENAFKVTTRYAVLVGFPLILIIGVLAYPIIVLFGGVVYAPAATPLSLLCVASLFGTLGVAINPTFFTLERTKIASLIVFASIVADALASYVFIVSLGMGMIGAAVAKVVASVVAFALGTVFLTRLIQVKFDTEMLWKVLVACLAMVLALLGFDFLRQFLIGPPYHFLSFRLLLLPVYVAIAIGTYLLAIIALGAIRKDDLELFREYLPGGLKWAATLLERFVRNQKNG